jgi:hypothetical protein
MNDSTRSVPALTDDVATLLRGLRDDPVLRGWVAVGSVALVPVPEPDEHGWTLWALLAQPIGRGLSRVTYRPAWGAVQWRWPSRRVCQRLRLPTAMLAAGAAGLWCTRPDGDVEALRDEVLGRIGELLSEPSPADPCRMERLGEAYQGLLPAGAYTAYHAVAPGSAGWLRPA